MTDQRRTISVVCEVHGAWRELVVTMQPDRLVLDMHADSCCVIRFGERAAGELFEVLGDWLG